MEANKLILAIDFDGTIVVPGPNNYALDDFEFMPDAKQVLKDLYKKVYLILWTCRQGEELKKAEKFLKKNGIKFHNINENFKDLDFKTSDKIYADIYFDDRVNTGKINWLKFKKQVENEMKRNVISKFADEIMQKVAAYTDKRPPYLREEPDKSVPERKEIVKGELQDLWNSVGSKVTEGLDRKTKTNELLDFATKVKQLVVKNKLPENVRSANWLDDILKELTNHDWLIPINVFRQDAQTTIQAFKNDEMKK